MISNGVYSEMVLEKEGKSVLYCQFVDVINNNKYELGIEIKDKLPSQEELKEFRQKAFYSIIIYYDIKLLK